MSGSGRPFYPTDKDKKGKHHLHSSVLKTGLGSANGTFLIFLTFWALPQKLPQR